MNYKFKINIICLCKFPVHFSKFATNRCCVSESGTQQSMNQIMEMMRDSQEGMPSFRLLRLYRLTLQCCFLRTDVMMREIEEQLFDAEEDVRLGKHVEFDQLAQEPANFQLGLDVDLVLLPNMPPANTDSSNQIKSVLRIRIRDPVPFQTLNPRVSC